MHGHARLVREEGLPQKPCLRVVAGDSALPAVQNHQGIEPHYPHDPNVPELPGTFSLPPEGRQKRAVWSEDTELMASNVGDGDPAI